MTFQAELINNAECSVIGGILLYPDECRGALESLCKDDFYNPAFKAIFSVLKDMEREGKPIDVPLVISRIDRIDKSLREAAVFCADSFISCAGYEEYIQAVKSDSQRRRVKERVQQVLLTDTSDPLNDIAKIIQDEENRNNSAELKGYMPRVYVDFLESIGNKRKTEKRVRTGYKRLDNAIGGLRPQTMSIIGARPSTGKTTFALNIIRNQLFTENKTLMFSLEMSAPQIMERLFSDLCNISYGKISRAELEEEQNNKIAKMAGALTDLKNFWVIDSAYTIEEIARVISQLKPNLVVIDFIQCVKTTQKFHDRREEVDYISQEFKRLAKRYNCHIMVLSQITRAGKDSPRMSDLKESGGLEQDGDYIILLHRPYVLDKASTTDPKETAVMLDKNKYGSTGTLPFCFEGQFQRFIEL